MTSKTDKETKPEVTDVTTGIETVTKKQPVNPKANVLSQAAYQLYTSAAHSKEDVAERLQLLEDFLVKVNAEE